MANQHAVDPEFEIVARLLAEGYDAVWLELQTLAHREAAGADECSNRTPNVVHRLKRAGLGALLRVRRWFCLRYRHSLASEEPSKRDATGDQ